MDIRLNPYSPGAGAPPPELAGRDSILEDSSVLFSRIRNGRSAKGMLLTGLRGVGKTVLLNKIQQAAEEDRYNAIYIEAAESKPLGILLAPALRTLLLKLDRIQGAKSKVQEAFGVLRSFVGPFKLSWNDLELGLDTDSEKGTADSGDIEIDLPILLQAVSQAALDRNSAVVILIDEVQYLAKPEVAALVMALHRTQQRQLPLAIVGAGLPTLPRHLGESKSYAERLFDFPVIGALSENDARKAIQDPAIELNVTFTTAALDEIYRLTKGYPYFLQEWAYVCWNAANERTIDISTVHEATTNVVKRLDNNFFKVRFERLTTAEKKFLRAMAQLGPGSIKTADIGDVLGVNINSLSPRRAALIEKGMIYSPTHGDVAFTVPLFDEFVLRAIV